MPGSDRGTAASRRPDGTLAIDGVAEGVNDAAQEDGADGAVDNLAGAFDGVTFLDETIVTEDGNTDVVSFKVEAHASYTRRELHHLLCDHAQRMLVPNGWQ
jgi:hypothetical protein